MSSDNTVSNPRYTWTPSDSEVEGEVDNTAKDVDRQVSLIDQLTVVNINNVGILEQGVVRSVAEWVEFLEHLDVSKPSTSGRPLGILSDNPASMLTDDEMSRLRTIYGIPASIELRASKGHKWADWDIPGWTCFYEYTLRLGFRFLIPSLA